MLKRAVLLILLFFLMAPCAWCEFPDGWGRRCAITIDSTKVDADLTDWTFIVTEDVLPSEMFDADGDYPALEGGGDIRFSPDPYGSTRLPCDVRSFHIDNNPSNGYAEIAVKVPTVSSSTDTVIYVWYNKSGESQPAVDSTYGQYNAYDENYFFVSDNGGGSDRTENGNDGTGVSVTPGDATGRIGDATEFDGSSDYIYVPDDPAFDISTDLSVFALVKKTSRTAGALEYIISHYDYSNNDRGWSLGHRHTSVPEAYRGYGSIVSSDGTSTDTTAKNYLLDSAGSTDVQDGDWYVLGLTFNSGTLKLYDNGAETTECFTLWDPAFTSINPSDGPLMIGATGNTGTNAGFNDCTIDEIRLSSAVRSDAWIKADYENLMNTSVFASASAPEAPFPHAWRRMCALTIDSSKIDADLTDWTFVLTKDTLPAEMFDSNGAYPALEGGGDIRFSSDSQGVNRLACDIRSFHLDSFSSGASAEIAVKVPSVSSSADTTIYVWYNCPQGSSQPPADSMYGQYNAYDSSYKAVWADGGKVDRTGNNADGTENNVSVGTAAGKVGNATDYNGSNGYVDHGDSTNLESDVQGTIESLFSLDTLLGVDTNTKILGYGGGAQASSSLFAFEIRNSSGVGAGTRLGFIQRNSAEGLVRAQLGSTQLSTSTWFFGAIRSNGTACSVWLDSGNEGLNDVTGNGNNGNWFGDSDPVLPDALNVGAIYFNGSTDGFLDGKLDEIRASSIYRSDAWLKANYENLINPDTFSSVGTPDLPFPRGWGRKCAITIDSSKIDADLTDWTFVVTEDILPEEMFDADGSYPGLEGGGDIRFSTDAQGLKRLACDVRSFHIDNDPSNGYAEIAVKVPSVSSSSDTTIYIWYNKSAAVQPPASDTFGQYNAYDGFYEYIDPDAGGTDRTRNQHIGILTGTAEGGVAGQVGRATRYDNSAMFGEFLSTADDYLNTNCPPIAGDQTLEALVNLNSVRSDLTHCCRIITTHDNTAGTGKHVILGLHDNADLQGFFDDGGTPINAKRDAQDLFTGTWYHTAARYNKSEAFGQALLNGASVAIDDQGSNYGDVDSQYNFHVAASADAKHDRSLDGQIDEIRISSVYRSAGWIKADYENLMNMSTFAAEGIPASNVEIITNTDAVYVAENGSATLQVKLSAQPAGDTDVTVEKISGDADITLTGDPVTLTFTTGNWDTYQPVTLSAADDSDEDAGSAYIRCTADGLAQLDIMALEDEDESGLSGWARRCAITIDSSKIDADLTDWTFIVTEAMLPEEMFDADGDYPALEGGGDIRFSSDPYGETRLACDIRSFHIDNNPASGYAEIAVKVPTVSSSTDTVIYVWYNRPGSVQPAPSDTYGQYNAYDQYHEAVYPLSDFNDRTANQYHLNASGTPTVTSTAKIGSAVDFERDDSDYLYRTAAVTNAMDVTFECMGRDENAGAIATDALAISQGSTADDLDFYILYWNAPESDIHGRVRDSAGNRVDQGSQVISGQTWYYVGCRLDRVNRVANIFVNGTENESPVEDNVTLTVDRFSVGALLNTAANVFFDGQIDEVRISGTGRSVAWRAANYANQMSPGTFAAASDPEAPFPHGWRRSCALTIDSSKIDADLTDWTMILTEDSLPAEMFDADGEYPAQEGGGDIRFSSDSQGVNRLACDIRVFHLDDHNMGAGADIAVKIPLVSSARDTTIYVWYNCPQGASQPAADSAWGQYNAYDSSFEGVWPEGGGADRTGNQNNGTENGGVSTGASAGTVDSATQFDALDDFFRVTDDPSMDLSAVTVSTLVNPDTVDKGGMCMLSKRTGNNASYIFRFSYGVGVFSGRDRILFGFDRRDLGGEAANFESDFTMTANSWQYIAATHTYGAPGNTRLYKNGSAGGGSWVAGTGGEAFPANGADLTIGRLLSDATNGELYAVLDEIRLSSTVRSAAWLKAEYENLMNPGAFVSVGASSGIFPQGWERKCPITIDSSAIDADLTDWTFIVTKENLPDEMFLSAGDYPALEGGGDIRFSSDPGGLNRLACDIRTFHLDSHGGGSAAEIAVKVPSVNAASDTTIYIWYGKAGVVQPPVTDAFGQYNAYDGSYALVSPGGGDEDRTSNQWTVTPSGGVAPGTGGQIGDKTTFSGNSSHDYYEVGDAAAWNDILSYDTSWTLECLGATNDNTAIQMIMSKARADTVYRGPVLYYHGPDNELSLSINENHSPVINIIKEASHTPSAGQYYHYSATYDGSNNVNGIELYIDGIQQTGTDDHTNGTITTTDHTDNLLIGARNWGMAADNGREWDGDLDEIRISSAERSAAWIKADYENLMNFSDFAAAGTPESTIEILTDQDTIYVDEGSGATLRVKLSAQPSGDTDVTIVKVSGDADITVTGDPVTLTFTTVNWDTYQDVTVNAAEDSDTDANSALIRCTAPGLEQKNITAVETDDDSGLSAWGRKCAIVIDSDNFGLTEDLTDWTFIVTEDVLPAEMFASAGSYPALEGGGDIRFSSDARGLNRLPCDVRIFKLDSGGGPRADIAVKIPTLTFESDTTIYIWYNKPGAMQPLPGSTYGRYNAYDANYRAVWPDGGKTDRTRYGNDGYEQEGLTAGGENGPAGTATYFDGTDDRFDLPSVIVSNNDYTIEALTKHISGAIIYAERNSSDTSPVNQFYYSNAGNTDLTAIARDADSDNIMPVEAGVGNTNAWQHAAFVRNGSTGILYRDGLEKDSATNAAVDAFTVNAASIGAYWWASTSQYLGHINATLDEIRISLTQRSASWIKADYENLLNETSFASCDSPELYLSIVADSDTPSVPEDSSATLRVKLSAKPATASVNVTVSKQSGDADITLVGDPVTLTFTDANWDTYQDVTLNAAEDNSDTAAGTATIRCTSAGLSDKYVTATEEDDDFTLTVNDDGNGFTTPSGATIVDSDDASYAISAAADNGYTFSNWTVEAGAGTFGDENDASTTVNASADVTVQANFTLNDYEITTDTATLNITEGGSAELFVKLTMQPTAGVTVNIARNSGDTDITVGSATLDFTTANWDTYQSVTISAASDGDAIDDTTVVRLSGASMNDVDVTVNAEDTGNLTTDWRRKCALTIDSADIDADLTDWTCILTEDTLPSELFDANHASGYNAQSGGADIRFTTDIYGANRLACDVRLLTTDNNPVNGKADIAVKIPSVSSSTDTTIFVWYGNATANKPAATDTYGQYNAYDSSYVAVYPMSGDTTGTDTIADRTISQSHGNPLNLESNDSIDGKIDTAVDLDGGDEAVDTRLDVGDAGITNVITVALLMRVDDNTENGRLFASSTFADNKRAFDFAALLGPTFESWRVAVASSPGDSTDQMIYDFTPSAQINGDWYHLAARYNGALGDAQRIDVFQNGDDLGAPSVSGSGTDENKIINDENQNFFIGNLPDQTQGYDGAVDEVRVSSSFRSAAWLKADYINLLDPTNLITTATPNDAQGPSIVNVTPSTLNDSNTSTAVTVQITFDKAMDPATNPSPTITGLGTDPYTITATASPWSVGDTVWSGTFTFNDDNESATGTYNISGFKDASGGLMAADNTHTVSVDTQTPAAPAALDLAAADDSGSSNSDDITSATTNLTISGTAEANSTVEVFDGAASKGTVTANGAGAWTLDIDLAEGNRSITATATDAAGNTSAASTALAITVDTTAPAGYSVSFDQSVINAANENAASFTFTGAEVGSTYNYSIDDTSGATAAVTGSAAVTATDQQIPGINVSTLDDDTLTLTVTLTDVAGNTGANATDTITKDTVAPAGYSVSLDQSYINATNQTAASFTFTGAEVGATYNYQIDDTNGGTAPITGTAAITSANQQVTGIDLSTLNDDTLTLTVTLTDAAGNTGANATDTITKDTVAPSGYSVSLDQSVINAANQAAASFTFTGAEVGSTYNYSIDDTNDGTAAITGTAAVTAVDQQITGIDLSTLDDDTLTLTVTLTDAAGNTGANATDTITKDTGAPAAPTGLDLAAADDSGISTSDDITNITTNLTITGTAEANATVELFDGAASKGTSTADGTGNWTMDIDLAEGAHPITATATDAAANTSVASGVLTITVDTTAPADPTSITVINPVTASGQSSVDADITFASAPEAGTITVRFDDGSTTVDGLSPAETADTTTTITGTDISSLLDGPITVTASITDTAGNTNASGFTADASISKTTATYTITPGAGLTTTENVDTAQFTIVLDSAINADLTLALSSSDESEGTVSPASLTFTAANWNTPQTVTITGVDDALDDGDIPYSIIIGAAATTDPDYNGTDPADVTVTNTDNDGAGILVSPTSGLTTTESGDTAQFTVVLSTQPTGDVSLALSSSDESEGTVSPASLTFTSTNWDTPQSVTITGVDDTENDGDITYSIITAAAVSTDTDYNGIDPDDVSLSNTDDDSGQITITPTSGLTTSESGTSAVFTVVLETAPSADVLLGFSSLDTTESLIAPKELTFTSENWSTPQSITITGVDDHDDDGDITCTIQSAAAVSADTTFHGINPPDITVTNTDNDGPGVEITESGSATAVTEGSASADSYTLALTSAPTSDVTITVTSSTQLALSPESITFTTGSWSTPQSISVRAAEDSTAEGTHTADITHSASSTDLSYDGISIETVTVTITDNDSPGISVTESGGSTFVSESGTTDTCSIVLMTRPAADVTIQITGTDELTTDPGQLTFTPDNWDRVQSVSVFVSDNSIADGNRMSSLAHTIITTDTDYSSMSIADIEVTIEDNDTPGVIITESGGTTRVSESGSEDTYSIVLATRPVSDVTVMIRTDSQVNTDSASVIFTTEDWASARSVTVSAVDDTQVEGTHIGSIRHSVISTDAEYDQKIARSISAVITDNDGPGLEVGDSTGANTLSPGESLDYQVVLTEMPAADVTVTIAAGEGLSVSPQSLTFSPSNWTTAQSITVTAAAETAQSASVLSFAISSADTDYDALAIEPVTVIIEQAESGGEETGGGDSGSSATGGVEEENYPVTTSKGFGGGCFIDMLR